MTIMTIKDYMISENELQNKLKKLEPDKKEKQRHDKEVKGLPPGAVLKQGGDVYDKADRYLGQVKTLDSGEREFVAGKPKEEKPEGEKTNNSNGDNHKKSSKKVTNGTNNSNGNKKKMEKKETIKLSGKQDTIVVAPKIEESIFDVRDYKKDFIKRTRQLDVKESSQIGIPGQKMGDRDNDPDSYGNPHGGSGHTKGAVPNVPLDKGRKGDILPILRKIVDKRQHERIKFPDGGPVDVDLFSASAMIQVHDALKPESQRKFKESIKNKLGFLKMHSFALSAIGGRAEKEQSESYDIDFDQFLTEWSELASSIRKKKIILSERALKEHKGTKPHKHPHPPVEEESDDEVKKKLKKANVAATTSHPGYSEEKGAKSHNCATHVEHTEWGKGSCIPTQHTLVETEDGEYEVTHYDVLFDCGVKEDVPVEDLKILGEGHHSHNPGNHNSSKKKVKEDHDCEEIHPNMSHKEWEKDNKDEDENDNPVGKVEESAALQVKMALDDAGWKLGSQGSTLVRNILKKTKGDAKSAIDKIMKDYPGLKKEEVEATRMPMEAPFVLDEKKSATGYELYHKDFSSAMQHAYAHAKSKGFVIDPKEIDDKVATGPKKPSSGETNRYSLKAGRKKVEIQVANLDNKQYELNMYIEGKDYEAFFNSALKKFGVSSPADLKGDQKKKFYDYVDANWKGENEVEENVYVNAAANSITQEYRAKSLLIKT